MNQIYLSDIVKQMALANMKKIKPIDNEKVLSRCKELIKDYPVDCVQYSKIKEQINVLESELKNG